MILCVTFVHTGYFLNLYSVIAPGCWRSAGATFLFNFLIVSHPIVRTGVTRIILWRGFMVTFRQLIDLAEVLGVEVSELVSAIELRRGESILKDQSQRSRQCR